jgi:hypothetical protein
MTDAGDLLLVAFTRGDTREIEKRTPEPSVESALFFLGES